MGNRKIEGHGYSQYRKFLEKGEIGYGDRLVVHIETTREVYKYTISKSGELELIGGCENINGFRETTEQALSQKRWSVRKSMITKNKK